MLLSIEADTNETIKELKDEFLFKQEIIKETKAFKNILDVIKHFYTFIEKMQDSKKTIYLFDDYKNKQEIEIKIIEM